MKKTMILASALAFAVAAQADFCAPGGDTPVDVKCPVWYLQVSMKTLVPQAVTVKGSANLVCAPGTPGTNCVALTLGTRNFSGGWWDCNNLCSNDTTLASKHALKRGDNFILWENTTGVAVTKRLESSSGVYTADNAPWSILDRFGPNAEYVEGYINIALQGAQIDAGQPYQEYAGAYMGVLTLAGAGLWERNTVSMMRGYAVAAWAAECGACWDLCENFTSWCNATDPGYLPKDPISAGFAGALASGTLPPIAAPALTTQPAYIKSAANDGATLVAGAGTWSLRYYNAANLKLTLGQIVPARAKQ